ncbi:MAG: hypothetical protein PHS82_06370 [Lachnospiraceae bacterium]|nr:hypothetical protein [Lachnospiraceae bacterium]
MKKAIKLEKELQAISSSKQSGFALNVSAKDVAEATIKSIAHLTIRDKH